MRRYGCTTQPRLTEALDDDYDRDDDEPDGALVWFEHVITHGMQRIRAHLELSGDELHVHANSEARFERVLATIRALDPSVTVLRETREPAGDEPSSGSPRAARRNRPRSSTRPPTRRSLRPWKEMARTYEAAWLDEFRFPRLAGHTPRECANEPDPPPRPDPATRLVPTGHRPTRDNEPRTPTRRARPELIGDASCVKKYVHRPQTPYEHAWEIRDQCGYRPVDDQNASEVFARWRFIRRGIR